MCNIVHVYVNYANVLKGLQFPTPTLPTFGPNKMKDECSTTAIGPPKKHLI